jgi:GNAT superfamily N-acetyltransferase
LNDRVGLIEDGQIDQAADALARAFFDDPLQTYILPEDDQRVRLGAPIFKALLTYGYRSGHVLTPRDAGGAAVWMKPGGWEMSEDGMQKAGFFELPGIIGEAAFDRFANFFGYIEQYHRRDAPAAHWYLAVIGVDPPRQGQGLAASMIRPVLSDADKGGLACYLETAQPKNVPLYEHLGFKVVLDEVEPASGVRFWTFLREPDR